MKKILALGLLLAAGVIFAASSLPGGQKLSPNPDDNALTVYCWCGEATGPWETFEFYFDDETGEMWGTWYKGGASGWINGSGRPDPAGLSSDWYIGEGIFGGDDDGVWKGNFILTDRCWGKVSSPDDPYQGKFEGWPCD